MEVFLFLGHFPVAGVLHPDCYGHTCALLEGEAEGAVAAVAALAG